MEYTNSQREAIERIKEWFLLGIGFFWLAGPGGTGKSWLTPHILKELGLGLHEVLVCAPSNKAKSILMERGFENAKTVHKVIKTSFVSGPKAGRYQQVMTLLRNTNDKHELKALLAEVHSMTSKGEVFWSNRESVDADQVRLILVDEVSMLSQADMDSLLSIGCPILAIGDNYQLPPVGYKGFTDGREPNYILKENMRQINLGGNIVKASYAVRENPRYLFDSLPFDEWKEREGQSIMKIHKEDLDPLEFKDFQFFAHSNNQCFRHIEKVRNGLSNAPVVGDQLIAYQNKGKLTKGKIYDVVNDSDIQDGIALIDIRPIEGGEESQVQIPTDIFKKSLSDKQRLQKLGHTGIGNQAFDSMYYSNCITIHKSQGGEWNSVGLYLPKSTYYRKIDDDDLMRLKYTAITRAKQKLLLVI